MGWRLPTVGNPRDDAIIKAFEQRIDSLASEFGQRHDLARRDNAEIQQRITELAENVTRLGRRMDDIERKAGYNLLLDQAKAAAAGAAQTLPVPKPGTGRPLAVDEACATTGEPRMVLLPEFGLEIEPEPGSNPDGVWPTALRAIDTAASGGKKRRR